MTWTKEKAEKFAASNLGENKVIFLDGTATLKKCSAMDYLVHHCGYIFGGTRPAKERKYS